MTAYEERVARLVNEFWSEFEEPEVHETIDGVGVTATHMDSPLLSTTPLISASIFLYKAEIDMLSDDELSSRIGHGLAKALGGTRDEYDSYELPWDLSERAPEFHRAQVIFFVQNVERTVAFYTEYLGFEELFRMPTSGPPEYIDLHLEDLTIGVMSREVLPSTGCASVDIEDLAVVCLWTNNIVEAHGRLLAQDVDFLLEPSDILRGRFRIAWLRSQDNGIVQIAQEVN